MNFIEIKVSTWSECFSQPPRRCDADRVCNPHASDDLCAASAAGATWVGLHINVVYWSCCVLKRIPKENKPVNISVLDVWLPQCGVGHLALGRFKIFFSHLAVICLERRITWILFPYRKLKLADTWHLTCTYLFIISYHLNLRNLRYHLLKFLRGKVNI